MIRVDISPEQQDKNLTATVGLTGDAAAVTDALLPLLPDPARPARDLTAERAAIEAESRETAPDTVALAEIIADALPADAIVAGDSSQIVYMALGSVLRQEQPQRPPMFWEHEGNAAVRIGKWKLVREYPKDWELYDMEADRTELNDLAAQEPGRVAAMKAQYEAWAQRCGVLPRDKVVALMRSQGVTKAFWEEE